MSTPIHLFDRFVTVINGVENHDSTAYGVTWPDGSVSVRFPAEFGRPAQTLTNKSMESVKADIDKAVRVARLLTNTDVGVKHVPADASV